MIDFTPENLTDEQIITLLQMLFKNLNKIDSVYYDMFINPIPMDVTLERYDENGTLQSITLPNRAKDRLHVLQGNGAPEGTVEADTGSFYFDVIGRELYTKTSAMSLYGWTKILSEFNFRSGEQFLAPTGDGSAIRNLNANNINGGLVSPAVGGTGTGGLTGIIKGNGPLNPCTVAVEGTDYLGPTSFTGMINYFAGTVAPAGWLIADGHEESRTEYARLFAQIGTTYGEGDGSTTFNLPNLVNKLIMGNTTGIGGSTAMSGGAGGADFTKGISVSSGWTATENGWLTLRGYSSFNNDINWMIDGQTVSYNGMHWDNQNRQVTTAFIAKGQTLTSSGSGDKSATFYPTIASGGSSMTLLPCIKY